MFFSKQSKILNNSKILIAVLVLSFISFSTFDMISNSSGKTGESENGCSCHGGNSSSTVITFSSGSGSFNVKPSSNTEFTVRVANSSKSHAGANITVKTGSGGSASGTLTAGSGLKVSSGELTHNGKQTMSGGGYDFKFTWTAPTTPGEYTIFAAGNAVDGNGGTGSDTPNISNQKVTVMGVTVSGPNGGESLCGGISRNITWTQFGVGSVKIELLKGNTPTLIVPSTPANTGTYSWSIPANQEVASDYKIRISDVADGTIVDESNATFSIGGAPTISTQPAALTVCTGKVANMTVVAAGNGLTYKWFKGGSEVTGQTTATLNLTNVKIADAGKYKVTVTNSCGNITSNEVDLIVTQSPAFTKQPENAAVCEGLNYTFAPEVLGTDNTYQWQKNNQNIPNATNLLLSIPNAQPTDAGKYKLVITSQQCGDIVTSQEATLAINNGTTITTQPEPKDVCLGDTVSFAVVATGASINYIWKLNGTAIPNSNKASISINGVKTTDAGDYTVDVIGQCGSPVVSSAAKLTLGNSPVISKQPVGRTINEGGTVSFSVESNGENTYQWQKDNVNLTNQDGPILLITNAKKLDAGDYTCNVINACGTTKSAVAKLIVNDGPKGPTLSVISNDVVFPKVKLGSQLDTTLVDFITNTGDEELKINEVKVDIANSQNNGDFQVLSTSTPYILQKGQKMDLRLRFKPTDGGNRKVIVKLITNGNNESINVSGEGEIVENQDPVFAVDTDLAEFNTTIGTPQTKTIKISNTGKSDGIIENATKDNNLTEFTLTQSLPLTLKVNESINLEFTFTPTNEGKIEDFWNFKNPKGDVIARIKLEGTALANSVRDLVELKEVKSYPNPTNGEFKIEFSAAIGNNDMFEIMDMNGNILNKISIIQSTNYKYTVNWNGTDMNGNKVSKGIYFGRINGSIQSNSVKLIID